MVMDEDAETMPHQSSSLTPPPPSSPLQVPSTLPSSSKDDIKNEDCHLCLDGGEDLYCCIRCLRVICNVCIMVPVESHSLVRGSDMDFTCPACHEAADRDNSGQMGQAFAPYWGFTFHTSSKPVLTAFPVMSSCIAMTAGSQEMDLQGCPPRAICEYLRPYFPPNALHFLELEWDFRTRAKIAEHKGKMETMREEERGDLFAGEEGPQTKPRPIAVKVDQFFSLLFTSGMDDLLKGATVVLLTCGWLVEHEQSFQDLRSSLRW
ncbi:hypothetical protein PAXRUDRAFT_17321 [Paxillus rubicundulus Ve08.2h10]|uniref:Uncharacterized protein n=1 Tax=Paxillus rubicundulus Ve08.2h10 TaxID=930991 RepID=A0A0D0DHZ0_9AGAM|nr:hypothetical protein PAXRUDRAFT_17321 [Paxillus rubicundulus Ve08.2h10]